MAKKSTNAFCLLYTPKKGRHLHGGGKPCIFHSLKKNRGGGFSRLGLQEGNESPLGCPPYWNLLLAGKRRYFNLKTVFLAKPTRLPSPPSKAGTNRERETRVSEGKRRRNTFRPLATGDPALKGDPRSFSGLASLERRKEGETQSFAGKERGGKLAALSWYSSHVLKPN